MYKIYKLYSYLDTKEVENVREVIYDALLSLYNSADYQRNSSIYKLCH